MIEVGKIAKAHGLRGEVIVELYTNRTERVDAGSSLVSGSRTLVIQRSQPHQHRFIVKFEGVDSRESAEALHGLVLSAEEIDDPDAMWIHELVGTPVVDASGVDRGSVIAVLANPAGDILETSFGHLVPLRFVTSHSPDQVVVDPPEGLFDL